ncbi:hypothetical protein S83_061022 [Arachis hypogaea]
MTKKERRAKKGPLQFVELSQANTEQVQQTGQNNSTANAEKTTLDAAAKTKKNKKKLPKTSARGQSVNHSQGEKINVSQSAPQANEREATNCETHCSNSIRLNRMNLRPILSVGSGQSTSTNQGVSTGVLIETMATTTSEIRAPNKN